jgi:hypothetical protein
MAEQRLLSALQPSRKYLLYRSLRYNTINTSIEAPATSTSVSNRRVSFIPVHPGEGRLAEPTAATRPWRRELVFMPETVGKRIGGFGRRAAFFGREGRTVIARLAGAA